MDDIARRDNYEIESDSNLELVDDFEYLFRMMTTVEVFLAERFKQAWSESRERGQFSC